MIARSQKLHCSNFIIVKIGSFLLKDILNGRLKTGKEYCDQIKPKSVHLDQRVVTEYGKAKEKTLVDKQFNRLLAMLVKYHGLGMLFMVRNCFAY